MVLGSRDLSRGSIVLHRARSRFGENAAVLRFFERYRHQQASFLLAATLKKPKYRCFQEPCLKTMEPLPKSLLPKTIPSAPKHRLS